MASAHGDLAIARVDADGDVAGEGAGGFLHEGGIAHGCGAEDHAGDAGVEPAFNARHVADAAAELNRRAHHIEDGRDGVVVDRVALERAVEIDNVQRLEAHGGKAQCLVGGIIIEGGGGGHLAAQQTDTHAVLEVDGRVEVHLLVFWIVFWRRLAGAPGGRPWTRGTYACQREWTRKSACDGGIFAYGFQRRKFASSNCPAFWLFSGWNCAPKRLSRATAATNLPP